MFSFTGQGAISQEPNNACSKNALSGSQTVKNCQSEIGWSDLVQSLQNLTAYV